MGVYNDSTPVPPAGYRRLGPENPLDLPLAPWVPYIPVGYQSQYSMIQPRAVGASRAMGAGEFSVEGPGWGWMAAAILVSSAAGLGAGYYAGRKSRKR